MNDAARIGKWAQLSACVNIGKNNKGETPRIGDHFWTGPGAKLFGGIVLGDNVKVGANAVVNKSFRKETAHLLACLHIRCARMKIHENSLYKR